LSDFERDLSQGSVIKQLIRFSLPFLLSNIIQSLYNIADMIIVGQFSGTASMSGVNIGGQVTFLLTNLVVGLSVGGTVLIGQYKGSGARKEMQETIKTLFTALLVTAVVLTGVMCSLRTPILRLMQTPAESFAEAKSYLLITSLGTIFIFGYNAFSAVMRGLGDSRRPLTFVAIACATNVVLDLILVGPFQMGATGAALATIASQALSMILCMLYFKRNDFIFDFRLRSFGFHKERLGMLLKIGIPTSVQNVITNLSFLFLTTIVNAWGVTASAAVGAVAKLNGFAILPAIAISSSISAMSAQNLGAKKQDRAIQTMRYGMIFSIGFSVIVFAGVQLFPHELLRIFSSDAEMIRAGTTYIRSFSLEYLFVPVLFSLNGLFIGAGHTTFSLINSCLTSLLVRIPVAYLLGVTLQGGLRGAGFCAPASSLFGMTVSILYYFSGKWKKAVIVHQS